MSQFDVWENLCVLVKVSISCSEINNGKFVFVDDGGGGVAVDNDSTIVKDDNAIVTDIIIRINRQK